MVDSVLGQCQKRIRRVHWSRKIYASLLARTNYVRHANRMTILKADCFRQSSVVFFPSRIIILSTPFVNFTGITVRPVPVSKSPKRSPRIVAPQVQSTTRPLGEFLVVLLTGNRLASGNFQNATSQTKRRSSRRRVANGRYGDTAIRTLE